MEDLKSIELNDLPIYDGRYIKTKIRTFDDESYTNFLCLYTPEDNIESESFTVISIDFSFFYANIICKYYLQVYLKSCANKVAVKQMIDYLDDNPFGTDED